MNGQAEIQTELEYVPSVNPHTGTRRRWIRKESKNKPVCNVCGKELKDQQLKYCSMKCRDMDRKHKSIVSSICDTTRTCRKCGKVKSIDEFYIFYKQEHRTHICKSCFSERARAYRMINPNRTKEKYARTKEARLAKIKKMQEYIGSSCAVCGYNRCDRALHFHHLDRFQKKDGNDTFGNWKGLSFEAFKDKVDRLDYVVLCGNCHAELHAGLITDQYIIDNCKYTRRKFNNENAEQ